MSLKSKSFQTFALSLIATFSFNSALHAEETNDAGTQTPVFVSEQWAKAHQNEIKLVDLSNKMQYRKFHLPNSTWINYAWLIRPQNGIQLSGGTVYMANAMSQLGIKPTDYVVIYDDMGNLDASRLYWELAKMKHSKVSMIDGGLVSWVLAQNKVTQTIPKLQSSQYPTPMSNLADAYTADKDEVLRAIKDPKITLLDARTEEEYIGNPKQKRSGHIPTAILFPWDVSVDANHAFKQRPAEQLKMFLQKVGITDVKQPIITYCHTGHRAARLWTMLKSLGFENVKLYDASMQEWEIDASLPVKQGKLP